MEKLVPLTAYQGGKQRIASQICDAMRVGAEDTFYDLCCGSGAVAIEMVNRGHRPDRIHMLDRGPWGLVWRLIGAGEFDVDRFRALCDQIPRDKSLVKGHMEALSRQPAHIDTPYVFVLLQASSFGSKAIWVEGDRWTNCSFRNYWLPTATSNRRSPVNPMMPMTDTLLERVGVVCERMRGVTGHHIDVQDFAPGPGVVYIDPPYKGTTSYGHDFDCPAYARSLSNRCFVSEGVPVSESSVLISEGRNKGGISGEKTVLPNREWLSAFN